MVGLLGKKLGMSRIFDEDGRQIPVTVLEVGPCYVTAIRTKEKNGYQAVQLGFDTVKEKRLSKPKLGVYKKLGLPPLYFKREIRSESLENLAVGNQVSVENFEVGDYVDVIGTSIGKGFQGVVKRLGYTGGGAGHGSMFGRVPGGIGSSAGGRGCRKKVRKGKGLPGHMGNERVSIQNLKVVKIDVEKNLLVLEGSVPGFEGNYLVVQTALKRGKKNNAWKVKGAQQESTKASSETSTKKDSQEGPK